MVSYNLKKTIFKRIKSKNFDYKKIIKKVYNKKVAYKKKKLFPIKKKLFKSYIYLYIRKLL